jgi:outer membrane biosynthesis protein TonB
MKFLLHLSFFLICACQVAAQSQTTTDTVIVNMLNHTSEGVDSSRLEFDRTVQRYFNRNLRAPMRGREFMLGYATVSFVVDKEGNVINPQCPSMTNRTVGQEALRVVKKLSNTHITPLNKNGEPVVAKVNINICFTTGDQHSISAEEIKSKAAIVVVAFPPSHD